MEMLVKLLRPLFAPLLKLKLEAPHLPEGTRLVRPLRPSEAWLTFRYLRTMFGALNQVIALEVGMVVAITQLKGLGVVLAVVLGLIELAVVGFAFVAVRIDYELRHYLVGDRSLRVSQGAWTHHEVTLSYANVQNIEVTQGPVDRFFGIKSLTVSTAGSDAARPGEEASHVVRLEGLENADEVRELILGMLKHHRDAGLGEPAHAPHDASGLSLELLHEVRDAAKALQRAAEAHG